MTNYISFPNLGKKVFEFEEVAFKLFKFEIRWYGIFVTIAIISAVLYVLYRARQAGMSTDDVLDFAIAVIICGVIGTRAYYVLTTLKTGEYKTFYDVIAIWNGGLAIYGGIIGGGVAALVVALKKKVSVPLFFDCLAPGVMLGQIIGRWANFINGEAYGSLSEYTFFTVTKKINAGSLPWVMEIRENNSLFPIYAQPTFFYESLWNLIGFILINAFYKKKKYNGQIFFAYIAWYGFGRMFIEGMRTDSLTLGHIRISQLLAALCFIVGTTLFFLFLKKTPEALKIKGAAPSFHEEKKTDGGKSEKTDKTAKDEKAEAKKDKPEKEDKKKDKPEEEKKEDKPAEKEKKDVRKDN